MPKRAILLLLSLLLLTPAAHPAAGVPPAPAWHAKVDPGVLDGAQAGETEFLVFLADQADLSAAAGLRTKAEKGEFVYRTLSQHAERTQAPIRAALRRLGVEWRPYWVANMLWVKSDVAVIQALAQRADVARLHANPRVSLDLPAVEAANAALLASPLAIEWNISKVNAPDVWENGVTGVGAVIGGQDTGYDWDHPALKDKYRGWNGSAASHDYNWHDAIHSGGGACGADSPEPCDDGTHGTHTMGTMVGDDGAGNQVGMAPGAKWIGCRNMDQGYGTPATYTECYEWFIAPTPVHGGAGDPKMAPDVINNSWSCLPSEGCTDPDVLRQVVENVRTAGIVTVHSAGNRGPDCGTVNTPSAIYDASFSVGATTNTEADTIWSSSSRGPVTADGSNRMKPDVVAPGAGVRSSVPGAGYSTYSGTSMAGPHVAGLIALLVSAYPAIAGDVDAIESVVAQSARHLTTAQLCGGDSSGALPNNVYGWGRIDALAAYEALGPCTAPEAITGVTISRAGSGQVALAWSGVTGAGKYRVTWDAAPYFMPGETCDAGTCSEVTVTSFVHTSPGNLGANYTYVVQPVATCGTVQAAPSNRVGEFDYALVRGE
jgi:serine protease AprX